MADNPVCDELIRLLKLQRHDFINHLQVIHAMLQLGKVEQAMRYAEKLAKDSSLLSDTLALHSEQENCVRKHAIKS